MNNLVYIENYKIMKRILFPMFQLLDEKNITEGVTIAKEGNKLYICFDRGSLSDGNQLILEKISRIYSETLFYSDNKCSPNSDRLEYWCPDEYFDENTHITEKCRNKKMFVLELDISDEFTMLVTSIMLANALQEQDPLGLKINEESTAFDKDIIERHEHYISSLYPDLRWINLTVLLNKDNPLMENPYAPSMSVCEINSPVSCDNIVSSILVGYNEKRYITFSLEKEELARVIKEYFERQVDDKESIVINEVQRKLLKS